MGSIHRLDENPGNGVRSDARLVEQRERVRREVVSFVRRSDRMNPSQQRAWDEDRHRYLIEVTSGPTSTSVAEQSPLDWPAIFGRPAPLVVEIGSGNGDSLVAMAQRWPEANLVAFEVFTPALASTIAKLTRAQVTNVRLLRHDGAAGLRYLFAPASVAELWTHFPDPWHKVRHHKRRLVSPEFARRARNQLVEGGRWRLATDWQDYAQAMLEVLDDTPGLLNDHPETGWAPRNPHRPVTRFEHKGVAAGREIIDLVYRAVPLST